MKIEWHKKGLIYCPSGEGYFKTHAARSIPYRLNSNILRIFFSSRDYDDRMLPTFIDVEIANPSNVIQVSDYPLLELGQPGMFDDSGLTLGSLVDCGDRVLLYYTGWKRRRVVSFELAIGLIIWDRRNNTFKKMFKGPILAQDKNHSLLTAGPFVVRENNRFKMWYCSGTDWQFPNSNPEPIYTVFYAESDDGINWTPQGQQINYNFVGEVISAPWVIKLKEQYLMWYSYRGHVDKAAKQYTIGWATSSDGIHWERNDSSVGISRSASGWDSEMICYPSFYPYQDKVYMFYSGNGVGRGGMGYAVARNFLDD